MTQDTSSSYAGRLTKKSFSKPSICAAIAAEFGLDPRTSLDIGLLSVPVPRLDACGDMLVYASLSFSAAVEFVSALR